MSKICDICGKSPVFGGSIVRSGSPKKKGGIGLNIRGKSKRMFLPNIQNVRVKTEDGETIKIKACTACIKAGKTLVVGE